MSADRVDAFADLRDEFFGYVQDIRYATLVTVDRLNRPRARVLLPVWEEVDGRPVGWIAAFPTPVKTAHVRRNPHVTVSYWNPRQNAAFADSAARWEEDMDEKRRVWDLYVQGGPPGVGYDPAHYWKGGPQDPGFAILRMDPFRVQVLRGRDLRSRIWQPAEQPLDGDA
ncbi:pyridoxamine 5'-phosphate oxidase family protein [Streptomyces purpureus]|uniref:Pyridoxamine 5'-phosphate oxidase n=1 Tax=Streptomyces purpureus TaxID=1951 RepID=A0A918LM15_9ACTN|nr:pyridoxamine 5'-phosphate oxidase family protein [Streptomyces purpureus]GGT22192.1 pyridoxamine 5'-phosphate oxidase [Streptomyces purpureus]